MNMIVVILQTSGATYRNSFKALICCSSKRIHLALNHLHMWNTSRNMDDFINLVPEPPPKNMDEKKLKNWTSIENGYKLSYIPNYPDCGHLFRSIFPDARYTVLAF